MSSPSSLLLLQRPLREALVPAAANRRLSFYITTAVDYKIGADGDRSPSLAVDFKSGNDATEMIKSIDENKRLTVEKEGEVQDVKSALDDEAYDEVIGERRLANAREMI